METEQTHFNQNINSTHQDERTQYLTRNLFEIQTALSSADPEQYGELKKLAERARAELASLALQDVLVGK